MSEEITKKQEKLAKLLAKEASSRKIGETAEADLCLSLAQNLMKELWGVRTGEFIIGYSSYGEFNRTFGKKLESSLQVAVSKMCGVACYLSKDKTCFAGIASQVNQAIILFNFFRVNFSAEAISAYKLSVAKAKELHEILNPIELYKKGYILTDGKFYRSFTDGAITALYGVMLKSEELSEGAKKASAWLESKIKLLPARQIHSTVDQSVRLQGYKHGQETNKRPGIDNNTKLIGRQLT